MIRPFPSNVMMPPPLLPPRGLFIPTRMIFNPQLAPAVLVTWIQLRCLAWGGWDTPGMSMDELAQITGKSQATLSRHMSMLRRTAALCWRSTRHGTITISFPDEPSGKPENQPGTPYFPNSKILNSTNSESPDPLSYFPPRILGYLSYQEDQDSQILKV